MSASEFSSSIDWDYAFSQLKLFPVSGCSDEEIVHHTPRRTYQLWSRLNDIFELLDGLGKSVDSKPTESRKEEPIENSAPPPAPKKPRRGLGKIGGLGLTGDHCQPQPGEDENDPFSVSRDIVRERTFDMINALCDRGMLVSYDVPTGNREAARDFFDKVWDANCLIFNSICEAMQTRGDEGRAVIMNLCENDKLNNYSVRQGDIAAASELYDRLLGHWDKHSGEGDA